jgi:hypothetical protein
MDLRVMCFSIQLVFLKYAFAWATLLGLARKVYLPESCHLAA